MKKPYDIHRDFRVSKYIHAPMDTVGARMLNRVNKRGLESMKFDEGVSLEEHMVLSNDGTKFGIKILRPKLMEKALPCIISYNGGGFMLKTSPLLMKNLEEYVLRLNCVVIAVDYRVGVSNPFPKPFQDAYAALKWAADHGEAYGINTNMIVVQGQSAGGGLAAAVCQKARDIKGPNIRLQLLIYPALDYEQSQPSVCELHDSPVWDAKKNKLMWQRYLKNGYGQRLGYASPLWADSFEGLPMAYIEVAEYDCLRDEGIAYGKAIEQAGGDVEVHMLEGGVHGYDNFIDSAYVDIFVDQRIELLTKVFAEDGV